MAIVDFKVLRGGSIRESQASKQQFILVLASNCLDKGVHFNQLALWWGVWPHRISMLDTTENLIALVEKRLLEDGLAHPGEYVVIMDGLPMASQARTNFVKLHQIEPQNE